jgi:hypothetical protein
MEHSVEDLRQKAKDNKVKGYTRMKKHELMEALGIPAPPKNLEANNKYKKNEHCNTYRKSELYDLARERNIKNRSSMKKKELCEVLGIPIVVSKKGDNKVRFSTTKPKKSSKEKKMVVNAASPGKIASPRRLVSPRKLSRVI